ncbi:hypothetical protein [Bacillus mobilis]|uniref:hypothetical protein n=1 Tax=Bacillus mobilis TaxID=2026190 RepID=UPI0011A8008A|nr:hypothetical protein [Bacillus mobilis]
MKKKRLVTSVLSLALAASVVFPSFASAEYNDFGSVSVIGDKEATSGFKVNPGYGYIKLWFENKGQSKVLVTVKNANTGKKYFTYELAKDEKYTWRSVEKWPGGSVASGNYVITYRDGNSGNVKVNFAGFSSNDEDEGRRG